MSLYVCLTRKRKIVYENGETIEDKEEVFSANITHNLNKMADKAKTYYALWRPEEIGISKANQLIRFLENGINLLKSKPDYFKKFNPENGWGSYEGLIKFTEDYLKACSTYPDADVETWR